MKIFNRKEPLGKVKERRVREALRSFRQAHREGKGWQIKWWAIALSLLLATPISTSRPSLKVEEWQGPYRALPSLKLPGSLRGESLWVEVDGLFPPSDSLLLALLERSGPEVEKVMVKGGERAKALAVYLATLNLPAVYKGAMGKGDSALVIIAKRDTFKPVPIDRDIFIHYTSSMAELGPLGVALIFSYAQTLRERYGVEVYMGNSEGVWKVAGWPLLAPGEAYRGPLPCQQCLVVSTGKDLAKLKLKPSTLVVVVGKGGIAPQELGEVLEGVARRE